MPFELKGSVVCGFPSPGEENRDEPLDFNELLIKHKSTTVCLRAYGTSMYPLIHDGDIVIVDRSLGARSGDIVVAEYEGDFTLKYLRKNGDALFLEPENSEFESIEINCNTRLFGVVTAIVRRVRI